MLAGTLQSLCIPERALPSRRAWFEITVCNASQGFVGARFLSEALAAGRYRGTEKRSRGRFSGATHSKVSVERVI